MGEMADDLIDRMMDDGYFPSSTSIPRGCNRGHKRTKKKQVPASVFDEHTRAQEFPSKKTDPALLPDYPEKTFDMGFFPKPIPKEKPKPVPDPWVIDGEDAPF